MVREYEVHASAVNVEVAAQVLTSHGRALAVPSREPVAPLAGPAHNMLGRGFLPQGEVGLVVLFAHTVDLAAGILDVLQRAAAQPSIVVFLVVGLDIEVHRAVRLVGEAVVHDLLHQLLLLDDVARGMRLDRRGQHVKRLHGLMVAVGVVLGNLHGLELLQACLLLDLVVALVGIVLQMAHIGDITHVAHFVAQMLQVAEHHVERDGGAGMPQMGVAINRGTADIHAHIGGMQGHETFFLTSERIVNQ